jgi:hypothetical protein
MKLTKKIKKIKSPVYSIKFEIRRSVFINLFLVSYIASRFSVSGLDFFGEGGSKWKILIEIEMEKIGGDTNTKK